MQRPAEFNAFEFAILAGLRAAQLTRGCTPRVSGSVKVAVIAQREIAEGKIVQAPRSATTREPRAISAVPGPMVDDVAPSAA